MSDNQEDLSLGALVSENQPLFNQAFIDSLPESTTYANCGVVMLCRYLHPFREKVEDWFKRLPEKEKKDSRSRLKSQLDSAFEPALFELYLHEYCIDRGWAAEKNPPVNGLTPDFLVDSKKHGEFYLEAANVSQPPQMLSQQREINALLNKLNSVQLPFTANLVLTEWPSGPLKPAQIARNVKLQLDTALRNGCREKVEIDLAQYALKGTFLAHFRESATRLDVLYTPPIGIGLPSESTMNGALKRKTKKYKNLGKPYVVSVCSTDSFPLNAHTLECELYGDVKLAVSLETNTTRSVRSGGMFPPRPGSVEASNTNLSAVLYAELERVDREWKYVLQVYHNPWAEYPLPADIFADLPQFVSRLENSSIKLEWTKTPETQWMPLFR